MQNPVNIGLAIKPAGGTTTSVVQYSLDDPFGSYATDYNTNAAWFDAAVTATGSTNVYGTILTPVRAVRLNTSALAGTSVSLTVVQSGIRGG